MADYLVGCAAALLAGAAGAATAGTLLSSEAVSAPTVPAPAVERKSLRVFDSVTSRPPVDVPTVCVRTGSSR